MARAGALERGRVRNRLIRLLATGEYSHSDLAARFDVTQPSITRFAQRHAEHIADVAGKLDDQFAGLWIADKVARVAEYQQDAEDVDELLNDPEQAARAGVQWAEMKRIKAQALRAVAEEKGELPSRQTVQHEGGVSVRYEIVNVDPAALT